MPTLQVNRQVGLEEARNFLSQELGPTYQVRSGSDSTLVVRRAGIFWATVRASWAGGATTFKVSGGGLIAGRLVSSLLIARPVRDALGRAFASSS